MFSILHLWCCMPYNGLNDFAMSFFVWVQSKTCGKNDKAKKIGSHQNMIMHPNTKTLCFVRYGKNNSLI